MEMTEDYNSDEDLFDDSERREIPAEAPPAKTNENNAANTDGKKLASLLGGLRSLMTGVPPSPAIIDPLAYDAAQILEKWHQHKDANLWWLGCNRGQDECGKEGAEKNVPETLKENGGEKCGKCSNATLGVYYNTCRASEELDIMRSRYQQWYVGCETDAFTSSWWCDEGSGSGTTPGKLKRYPGSGPRRRRPLTASAKKRARLNGWAVSPGRRLSHLARRRTAFGMGQLQAAASKKLSQVLVDMKAKSSKSSGKLSSAKKSASKKMKSPAVRTAKSCPKRALFQSPDDNTDGGGTKRRRLDNYHTGDDSFISPVECGRRQSAFTKRALWMNGGVRRSGDSAGSVSLSPVKRRRSSVSRSLSFTDHQPKNLDNAELSKTHKQKLLWAVSTALKGEGIDQSDERFRQAGTLLFKQCGLDWIARHQDSENSGGVAQAIVGSSTSEAMLDMARAYLPEIMARLAGSSQQAETLTVPQPDTVSVVSTLVTDDLLSTAAESNKPPDKPVKDASSGDVTSPQHQTPDKVTVAVMEIEAPQSAVVEPPTIDILKGSQCDATPPPPPQGDFESVPVNVTPTKKRKRSLNDDNVNEEAPPTRKFKFCVTTRPSASKKFTRVVVDMEQRARLRGKGFISGIRRGRIIKRLPTTGSMNIGDKPVDMRRVIRVRRIERDKGAEDNGVESAVELYIPNCLLLEEEEGDNGLAFVDVNQLAVRVDEITSAFKVVASQTQTTTVKKSDRPKSNDISEWSITTRGSGDRTKVYLLSDVHKKKLLWAAMTALQDSCISDPKVRKYRVTQLLKQLKKAWPEEAASSSSGVGGTSDRMLALARRLVQESPQYYTDFLKVNLRLESSQPEEEELTNGDISATLNSSEQLTLVIPEKTFRFGDITSSIDTGGIAYKIADLVAGVLEDRWRVVLTKLDGGFKGFPEDATGVVSRLAGE